MERPSAARTRTVSRVAVERRLRSRASVRRDALRRSFADPAGTRFAVRATVTLRGRNVEPRWPGTFPSCGERSAATARPGCVLRTSMATPRRSCASVTRLGARTDSAGLDAAGRRTGVERRRGAGAGERAADLVGDAEVEGALGGEVHAVAGGVEGNAGELVAAAGGPGRRRAGEPQERRDHAASA